jgi:hypothetical protein
MRNVYDQVLLQHFALQRPLNRIWNEKSVSDFATAELMGFPMFLQVSWRPSTNPLLVWLRLRALTE